ncbi:MAG: lmo0937 family membrane protein, partial [Elusimicrobia bacterium]|nr:lmo0937 family membrane protein [Elusimicrobiota bacterium]
MLETIAVILLVLWLLGLVSSYTVGGFIHVLLVLAIIIILVRLIKGKRPLGRKKGRSYEQGCSYRTSLCWS